MDASHDKTSIVHLAIEQSWAKTAPFWPLKNLIAVNPIAGFESLPFEDAMHHARAYFQQPDIPEAMQHVNRQTLKWLQVFFDQGQSTIKMPNRDQGLLRAVLSLLPYDNSVPALKKAWLTLLSDDHNILIQEILTQFGIKDADYELFLTLMLTTLPGWAAYVHYRTYWADAEDQVHPHKALPTEYLALRMILTALFFDDAESLLSWHYDAYAQTDIKELLHDIEQDERLYQQELLRRIHSAKIATNEVTEIVEAQMVFCIDVRSEPFRRAIEAQGPYDTFGFAGFFGVPVSIENAITSQSHASCPVLLKPAHHVVECPVDNNCAYAQGYETLQGVKKLYQSLKYTFAAPFGLVETMGAVNGVWMGVRSFLPYVASKMKALLNERFSQSYALSPDISTIPFEQQVAYAAGALKTMGLTQNFAPLVVFCGHGSTTENNAYASALDCGACGGRHGAPNARILAYILNDSDVRNALKKAYFSIPDKTIFIAAEHNTTTDEVTLFDQHMPKSHITSITSLKQSLKQAGEHNNAWRCAQMGRQSTHQAASHTAKRAQDWAQTRPEWGLAKNASFIIAPRNITRHADLHGRAFLHSYDWTQDKDAQALTAILTAPMIVTQWINAQYFFSTYDNIAYGSGSKVTHNITGKIGVMQGNSSDLMHGLPLQSVYQTDLEQYHQPLRLTVYVHAPKRLITPIIAQYDILQKLFGNRWVYLICYDPEEQQSFILQHDFSWVVTK